MNFDLIESARIDRRLAYEIESHGREHLLTIGAGSYISGKMTLPLYQKLYPPHALIGRFSALADRITFLTGGNHNYKNVSSFPFDMSEVIEPIFGNIEPIPDKRPNHFQVIVGHDVWIGRGATIMGGVKIGNGAVVGVNSVVTKDVPPYAIVAGNPGRIVKYRFDEATIKKLLAVKWWNWSLEKIADNFPLISDTEKFLTTHWSPELEQIPEDEIGQTVENLRAQGFKVYNFVADFYSPKPLYLKVITEFCQANFADIKLVIWLDKFSTDEDFNLLVQFIKSFGSDAAKNILIVQAENFSPHALRSATHFVATREMSTLECLDWLWDTDVKIVSALDAKIFDGEPPAAR